MEAWPTDIRSRRKRFDGDFSDINQTLSFPCIIREPRRHDVCVLTIISVVSTAKENV